jgi:hypothetical protein
MAFRRFDRVTDIDASLQGFLGRYKPVGATMGSTWTRPLLTVEAARVRPSPKQAEGPPP